MRVAKEWAAILVGWLLIGMVLAYFGWRLC